MFLSASSCKAQPGELWPDLGSSMQEICGDVGVVPVEGHEDDQRSEAPLCYEERLRQLGLFSMGKEGPGETSLQTFNT